MESSKQEGGSILLKTWQLVVTYIWWKKLYIDTLLYKRESLSYNESRQLIHNYYIGQLYPVSIETWRAGNNYVGASSSLADAEPAYHLYLKLWLAYLETGCRQYDDYYDFVDQEMTIKKIKYIYNFNTYKNHTDCSTQKEV